MATAPILQRGADAPCHVPGQGAGRHRIELFDDDMRARALARLETENDLRTAIDEGQLRVYYQPVVELPDTRGRRRGPGALGAPPPGSGPSVGLHPPGRGERPHPAHRRPRPERGLRPGGDVE